MPSIRQRVYTYLMLVAIPIFPLLYINKLTTENNILELDCKNILQNTKFKLICNIDTDKEYFLMPNLINFLCKDKIYSSFGIEYDYWSYHMYEVKIRITDFPERCFVPKDEYIIIGGPISTDIDEDGKITYNIPIKEPKELKEILISSYIDHCIGIFGEISYLFNREYVPKLTMKEFNRIMVCSHKIIYPTSMENKNGK